MEAERSAAHTDPEHAVRALVRENERLRAALREIQSLLNSDYPEWRIAEKALNG